MHHILQGGSVPPASNSRMPPLPHEPAGFYNDRGATVDIPLDSTKVHDLPLTLLLLCEFIFMRSALPKKNHITMLSFQHCKSFLLFFRKVTSDVIDQAAEVMLYFLDVDNPK